MIMPSKSPSKPVNGKLGKNPKVADKVKSLPLINEAAILSSLINAIEQAECFAKQFEGDSTSFYKKFRNDDQLFKEWKITVKIDPSLKTNKRGSIKIEGYMNYINEDLEILKSISKS